jgi:hypothetical protein
MKKEEKLRSHATVPLLDREKIIADLCKKEICGPFKRQIHMGKNTSSLWSKKYICM